MLFGINVIYLLILVAVSLGLILGLRLMQKSVLAELSHTLYEENDTDRYMRMLSSRRLVLVLRRSTLALLRLDGALFIKSADAVWEACDILDKTKLRPEERLNWYQKAFSFAVTQPDEQKAKDYLGRIDRLLEKEPDKVLQSVRTDAKLLYGVYIDRDASLIEVLEKETAALSGPKLGIVLYRLAKLYHFSGDDKKAKDRLKQAVTNLQTSPWLDVAERALRDPSVLDSE